MRLHSAFLLLAAAVVAATDEAPPVGQPSSLGVYNSKDPVQRRIRIDQSVNEERQGHLASVGLRPSRLIGEMEALHAAWGNKFPHFAQAWIQLDVEAPFLSVAEKDVFLRFIQVPDMGNWDSVISFMKGLDENVVVSTINMLLRTENAESRRVASRMQQKLAQWCVLHVRSADDVFKLFGLDKCAAYGIEHGFTLPKIGEYLLRNPFFNTWKMFVYHIDKSDPERMMRDTLVRNLSAQQRSEMLVARGLSSRRKT